LGGGGGGAPMEGGVYVWREGLMDGGL
jgi:hypothetical protein